jgi:DNA repair protein RecO (recombination protein O)
VNSRQLLRTRALLLKKVAYRDSDVMLSLFTERYGKLTAGARGAQNSRKRFGGGLEPIHTLEIELTATGDRHQLKSAQIERPRLNLTARLERLEAAGRALGWVRAGAVEREPEPRVWSLLLALLDELDSPTEVHVGRSLATAGLSLLGAWGWGLELDCCVRCGRPCPPRKPAWVDASRGGLICSTCGGARVRLEADQRLRLMAALQGQSDALLDEDATLGLKLTEAALGAHADIR